FSSFLFMDFWSLYGLQELLLLLSTLGATILCGQSNYLLLLLYLSFYFFHLYGFCSRLKRIIKNENDCGIIWDKRYAIFTE
ncbi:hypothetical protein KKF86_06505, partial [bacterium]|nr:hypothetical protein [bacterium]